MTAPMAVRQSPRCSARDGARPVAAGGGLVALWFDSRAASVDKLQAVWHASVLRHWAADGCGRTAHEAAAGAAAASWPQVRVALETTGWDLNATHLEGDGGSLSLS